MPSGKAGMTFVRNRLALALAIAHGQAGSYRFAGRISNDQTL
jgi:hypothetical protein